MYTSWSARRTGSAPPPGSHAPLRFGKSWIGSTILIRYGSGRGRPRPRVASANSVSPFCVCSALFAFCGLSQFTQFAFATVGGCSLREPHARRQLAAASSCAGDSRQGGEAVASTPARQGAGPGRGAPAYHPAPQSRRSPVCPKTPPPMQRHPPQQRHPPPTKPPPSPRRSATSSACDRQRLPPRSSY